MSKDWLTVPLNQVAEEITRLENANKILESEVETMTNAYNHVERKLKTKIKLDSIPPGFIVLTYDGEMPDPQDITLSTEDQKRWKDMGYIGGICLPAGWNVKSYSDKELADMGLKRIV